MSRALVKRRTLLQQLGATAFLAAPVFRTALGEAQASTPQRLIVVTFPGGARQLPKVVYSTPNAPHYESTETSFTFDKYLSAFAPLESDLLFFDNIGSMAMGGHTMIATLTGDGAGLVDDDGLPPFVIPPGLTSIDQAIAKNIGSQTRFSSLQLGLFTEQLDMESFTYKRCIYSSGVALSPSMIRLRCSTVCLPGVRRRWPRRQRLAAPAPGRARHTRAKRVSWTCSPLRSARSNLSQALWSSPSSTNT